MTSVASVRCFPWPVSPPGSHGVTDRILWAPIPNPPSVTSVASVRCFPRCACFSPRSHGVRVTDNGLRSLPRRPNVSDSDGLQPTEINHGIRIFHRTTALAAAAGADQPEQPGAILRMVARKTILEPPGSSLALRLVGPRSGGILERDRRILCRPISHTRGASSPASRRSDPDEMVPGRQP